MVLGVFSAIIGMTLLPTYHFIIYKKASEGRILEWNGSEAKIRYAIDGPGIDSFTTNVKFVYIRDQKAIKNESRLKLFYNSKMPQVIDLEVAQKYSLPLPMTIVFILCVGITMRAVQKYFLLNDT